MTTVVIETRIAAPIERCFDLARDVDAHVRSSAATRERVVGGRTTGLLELGDTVTFEGVHLGVRQRLTSRITEFDRPRRPAVRCAPAGGRQRSLHAGAWVGARDREKLETLCRYAARPAVAESRLLELADGRIAYTLKKRWKDGATAVVMTKEVLMERLCALVPKPREHLVTYHEVLAPAAGLRSQVVPKCEVEEREGVDGFDHTAAGDVAAGAEVSEAVAAQGEDASFRRRQLQRRLRERQRVPHGEGKRRGGRRRYPWASLLIDMASLQNQ